MDHFGLVQASDRLGQSVIVEIARTATLGLEARLNSPCDSLTLR